MSAPLTAFASEGEDVLPSGVTYSNIEAVIDAYVEEHESTTAAVSVAVFTDSDVVMEKAYGYSDIENAIANDKDTVFEWGSCTKLLVWASVMQLVEKGELDLNEDIRTYLPEGFLTKLKYDTPVTMLNLMNHNAGWQETFTDLYIKDKADVKELGAALQLIEPEQIHKPGTVVAYSNWGAALAAYIVENVSGQSFDNYVHEHIFEPLGMEHTALGATISDNEWVANKRKEEKNYTTENKSLGTSLYYISLYPAGMAMGTSGDFIRFAQAFLTAKGKQSPLFEQADTLAKMLSPSLFYADGTSVRNYHGFWTDQFGVPVIWHNGGTIGSSSWFAFDPVSGIGTIILTNQQHESVFNCGILPLVFGKYKLSKSTVTGKDISGMYLSARTSFKGYTKLYSLACLMQFVSNGEGGYSVPGPEFTVTSVGTDSYLLDMGGLKQDVIYASAAEGEDTVLQFPGKDYLEVNGYGVIAKLVLLLLFIGSVLYSLISLMISMIHCLKHKRFLGTFEKYRAIVNVSIITTAMLFVYISLKLFSDAPLIQDVRWSVILIAVLVLIPVIYTVMLAAQWTKLDCTRKEKIKLMMTWIASFIMITNVIYWEAYKFW
ncbi:serine hydrolase domain-containing protein [Paenibacillus sp. sgz5001063]|uniref:serine hydrolase domain-containing protein n=1 Tax=Paenibacillus sp. sgz5001063 TaxID=3242474 RepID=UPI0036D24D82